jgi:hypothetical protein
MGLYLFPLGKIIVILGLYPCPCGAWKEIHMAICSFHGHNFSTSTYRRISLVTVQAHPARIYYLEA